MRKTAACLLVAAALAASFLLGRRSGGIGAGRTIAVRTDTLTVRDTVRVDRPVVRSVEVVRVDTVRLASVDTVVVRDTVAAEVPVVRKVYAGKDYEAVVSGFRPVLESISVFPETRYVTATVREKAKAGRVSFGAAVGPTVLYDGRAMHGGVGVTAGLVVSF